ncbi:alpha/beta hydrolase [Verticiella sediminum]|uniref:Alpha/beta hydrolase n=1 Tax=Verticiella sediminum TaxID=1247510 RepID=A0A556B222_9BURK|nr:alpha/beta hydrolase [Verticiella sediminum]TSH99219.1 alpha/beta hydrolase [Verticiella sediminum]
MTAIPALAPIDAENEANYSLRRRHPERGAVYADYAERSARVRREAGALVDVAFGDLPSSRLDLFLPARAQGAPLLVFIHGGYWRALDKHIFSFIAQPYVRAGLAVALPNYALAPAATVTEIVHEVCRSVHWLATEGAQRWGYDAARICVSGHSAGGHMAAYVASLQNPHPWAHRAVGCVAVSGIFDLLPLLPTSINHDLGMDAVEAGGLSVKPEALSCGGLICAAGGLETDGFQAQCQAFGHAAGRAGVPSEVHIMPGRTHFDVLSDMADARHPFHAATLRLACGGRKVAGAT